MEPSHLRSLYRSLLRELPHRNLSAPRSPLHTRIRSSLSSPSQSISPHAATHNLEAMQQHVLYLRSQRLYATLLERYNPGMSMDEEERVRLSARRVGMDLPEEFRDGR